MTSFHRILQTLVSTLPWLLLPCSGAEPSPAAEPAPQNSLSLWQLIEQGGWAMWPLGLCSLLTFYLAFHGFRETGRGRFLADALLHEALALLRSKRWPEARAALGRSRNAFSRAAGSLLEPDETGSVTEIGKREDQLAGRLEQEEAGVSQWINYLNVVATVAPMIGLLGTVSGMIGAFQTIASGGMGKPELLAGDIGEALITTATGLIIAIPAMVAFFILRNRLANRMQAAFDAADKFLRAMGSAAPGGADGEAEGMGNEGMRAGGVQAGHGTPLAQR